MNSIFIALNLLKRMVGGKRALLIHIVLPVAAISLLIGIVGGSDKDDYSVAYVNADQGIMGAHFIRELQEAHAYRLTGVKTVEEVKKSVTDRKAAAAIAIPSDFTERLLKGETPEVSLFQLNVSEASATLRLHAESAVGRFADIVRLIAATGASGDEMIAKLDEALRRAQNKMITSSVTDLGLVPRDGVRFATGFMLMFLMINISSTVNLMIEDRRIKTMSRVYTAPVRSLEIAAGNFLGSFLAGSVQLVLILLFTRYVLRFDYGLPFFSQLLILELFLIACVGLATAVAGVIRNSQSAGLLNTMLVTPSCMIGGCFWPVDLMPDWMQKLSYFVPQRWAIDAIQNVSAGYGVASVGLHIAVLVVFAVVLLGFGSVTLQPHKTEFDR